MQEIILRIDSAEGKRKGEMKEVPKDSLAEKVRKRLADATLTVDYLKDLKARILRLSARTQSEYFHIQLYELLLSYGLTHDLRIIQTPHVKSLVQKLMVAPETGTLTEDQKDPSSNPSESFFFLPFFIKNPLKKIISTQHRRRFLTLPLCSEEFILSLRLQMELAVRTLTEGPITSKWSA